MTEKLFSIADDKDTPPEARLWQAVLQLIATDLKFLIRGDISSTVLNSAQKQYKTRSDVLERYRQSEFIKIKEWSEASAEQIGSLNWILENVDFKSRLTQQKIKNYFKSKIVLAGSKIIGYSHNAK